MKEDIFQAASTDLKWLRSVDVDALKRIGHHSEVGAVTAVEFVYHAAYHDCLHLTQICRMLDEYFDPLRGAMRAF